MDIKLWLEEFKRSWIAHDIDNVLTLFTKDVEYWESPHQLVPFEELKNVWQSIMGQTDIDFSTTTMLSENNKHAVIWKLTYKDNNGTHQDWAGTYIIGLNKQGMCYYFHHTGEKAILG